MNLPDVNILIYAHREDMRDHERYRRWLENLMDGDEAYGVSDVVLSSFIRIVTNPRAFPSPSIMREALGFAEQVRGGVNCTVITPGGRHWDIFTNLCRTAGVRGNLVRDAYLAALAIESGSEWITTDRGFGRFPGLRWRHPF